MTGLERGMLQRRGQEKVLTSHIPTPSAADAGAVADILAPPAENLGFFTDERNQVDGANILAVYYYTIGAILLN